jgi:HEAT repeat protein
LLLLLAFGVLGCEPVPAPVRGPSVGALSPEEPVALGQIDSLGRVASTDLAARRQLVEALSYPSREVRMSAAYHLAQLGGEGLSTLTTALGEGPLVQYVAAYGLGEAGASARGALPKLVAVLGGPDDSAAGMASWAIGKIAGKRPGSVAVLLEKLRWGNSLDRAEALSAIGALGTGAFECVPLLIRMLANPNHSVARSAGNVLIQIGPLVRPAVEAAAKGGDPRVRAEAWRVLSALEPPL